MDQEKIGKFIARIRKEKELTQEQLAEKLGVDRTTVSKWERGINSPDISLIQPLCTELGITITQFINGDLTDKDKKHDYNEIDFIEYYNKKNKKKLLKTFLLAIIVFVLVSIFAIFIIKYNSYNVYNINKSGDDIQVRGYFIENHNRQILIINNISYRGLYAGTDKDIFAKKITLELISDGKVTTKIGYENETEKSLDELLQNASLCLDENGINLNNIYLRIYTDGDKHEFSINLSI